MESMDRAREIAKDVPATSPDGVVPPTRPWTVVLLLDDGDQRQMFMEAVLAPDPVAAVEVARDLAQTPDSGWENATVTDIITIPGEHDAVGPSEPWWCEDHAAHRVQSSSSTGSGGVSARAIDRRQWEQSGIIQLVGGEIDDWHDMIERSADGWTLERVDDLTGWAPYTALYRMSLGDDSDESDHYYAVEEPNPLTCPKCGSDDDVRYTERVERAATATYRGGMIILDGSSLKVLDEVSERDGLYCEACDHDFAFPDGFVIEWT